MIARIYNGDSVRRHQTTAQYFLSSPVCEPSGPSTLTGSVIGSESATACCPGEVLCMFDMGQMNSGGPEQRG